MKTNKKYTCIIKIEKHSVIILTIYFMETIKYGEYIFSVNKLPNNTRISFMNSDTNDIWEGQIYTSTFDKDVIRVLHKEENTKLEIRFSNGYKGECYCHILFTNNENLFELQMRKIDKNTSSGLYIDYLLDKINYLSNKINDIEAKVEKIEK